jgi:hypothetical protein
VKAAHAVAIGLRSFVSVDDGIAEAMRTAAEAGAALVAAHTYEQKLEADGLRLTRRFSRDVRLRELAHRFELFNRNGPFGWVAEAGLPAVAAGDFHRPEHLAGWKTLVPGPSDEDAVVRYLRSPRPVYLARLEAEALPGRSLTSAAAMPRTAWVLPEPGTGNTRRSCRGARERCQVRTSRSTGDG